MGVEVNHLRMTLQNAKNLIKNYSTNLTPNYNGRALRIQYQPRFANIRAEVKYKILGWRYKKAQNEKKL